MGALYPSRIHTPRVHTRQGGRTKASAATRSSVASEVSRIVSAASLDTQGRGAVQSLYFDGMIYARRVRVRRAVSNDVLTGMSCAIAVAIDCTSSRLDGKNAVPPVCWESVRRD